MGRVVFFCLVGCHKWEQAKVGPLERRRCRRCERIEIRIRGVNYARRVEE